MGIKINRKESERIAELSCAEQFELWFDEAEGNFYTGDEDMPDTAIYIYDVEQEETADFIEEITDTVIRGIKEGVYEC